MMAPFGNRPTVEMLAHHLGRFALGLEAADGERALGHCVDVTIGAKERRYQKSAFLAGSTPARRSHQGGVARLSRPAASAGSVGR